jgi:hypothetical protein
MNAKLCFKKKRNIYKANNRTKKKIVLIQSNEIQKNTATIANKLKMMNP